MSVLAPGARAIRVPGGAPLYVGPETSCVPGTADLPVVHACKHPCYQRAVGRVRPSHPDYLARADAHDLYLNMIDTAEARFFSVALFQAVGDFARSRWPAAPLLIHCNRGSSRAPALALLLLAARGALPVETCASAWAAFPDRFQPGRGLRAFLDQHWTTLVTEMAP